MDAPGEYGEEPFYPRAGREARQKDRERRVADHVQRHRHGNVAECGHGWKDNRWESEFDLVPAQGGFNAENAEIAEKNFRGKTLRPSRPRRC